MRRWLREIAGSRCGRSLRLAPAASFVTVSAAVSLVFLISIAFVPSNAQQAKQTDETALEQSNFTPIEWWMKKQGWIFERTNEKGRRVWRLDSQIPDGTGGKKAHSDWIEIDPSGRPYTEFERKLLQEGWQLVRTTASTHLWAKSPAVAWGMYYCETGSNGFTGPLKRLLRVQSNFR
jgi:hypothetical protein